jgi:EpsI family protein
MIKLAVALAFLGLNFYIYHYLATEQVRPPRALFESFPDELGKWTCAQREEIPDKTISNLGVTDYLLCSYQRGRSNDVIGVYVGYHASQIREEGGGAKENSIHPPAHCLPGSGWDIIRNETVQLGFKGMPEPDGLVKRLIIAKGKQRQLTYYWYQSRGHVIARDWRKIILVGMDRSIRGRTDGSLIRFTIPIVDNDEEKAEALFQDLGRQVLEHMPAYVPE